MTIKFYRVSYQAFSIIGVQGSGKTNWIYYLARKFKKKFKDQGITAYIPYSHRNFVAFLYHYTYDFNEYFGIPEDPKYIFIAVDDMSFLIRNNATANDILYLISVIRHLNKQFKRVYVAFVTHYSKATRPFLRLTNVKILTSITSFEELEGLKGMFPPSSLYDFFNLYTEDPTKFYTLINHYGNVFITKIRKQKKPKFDIEVTKDYEVDIRDKFEQLLKKLSLEFITSKDHL